ncbi:PREDICTED: fructokinase-like 2, chloroplastic [Fragaria vesca subsp. vesca]|uniref:fructokinase-like 2, chloroplastic n=1 Tax=Fragaria vesca subsp. vesca TaxID=101020 RepID=UPI0002C31564|nr:PREDICTED: fructokinase-like 2, chloroplastic [Fragaria vesca subsp. vesca]
MALLSFTRFLQLPRCHLDWPNKLSLNLVQLQGFRLHSKKWGLAAMSKKINNSENSGLDGVNEEEVVVKKKKTTGTTKRTRKKTASDSDASSDEDVGEEPKKRGRRKKAVSASVSVEGEQSEKKVRKRRTKKKVDEIASQVSEAEVSDAEELTFVLDVKDETEDDLQLEIDDGEDISYTYGWPPLVCCFGAAQHAFVPSGRPANRLLDYEIHERKKDALWAPEKFIRSPGGCAGSVAIALASLGGKVAFMGKLGDDDYGKAMLYYMNANNVQTRSVRMDSRRSTAVSQMKIGKRNRLRLTCVRPCAEDSLTKSEINMDVLKEAKMFYFNTHSLLDQNMRSTTLQAIKIAKQLGGVVFYDVNLPLPLWQSSEETKLFIQQVWNIADIIEVTKQELEFLCGVQPSEEFDTKDNARSKFVHHRREMIAPLWHENLKVLFVTNGTSKIHYYTKEHDGAVNGMEDPPISPFTSDMSASGDGIVAALMRMLTVQPHLVTDREYLEHSIKYAIDCGVIDQWLLGRSRGFPPREDMEDVVTDPDGIRSVTEMEYRTLPDEVLA